MSLTVAIDFTASNGRINDAHSLHATKDETNEYEQAILQVANVLQSYDHFKLFPAFGFGGVPHYMGENKVSHCFPLNGNFEQPEVRGVKGIVDAYRKNLERIQMAGPTFFSSVVDIFMDFCSDGHELKTYFILLIITDGSIHDMRETKQLIVQASKLPCSIIIVGVGNANFEQMVELDSDETLLKDNKNNFAKRDIVQFVQFRKAVARGNLAEELLKEIPDQVCRYMEMTGYKPVPVNTDASKIEESVAKQIAETIQSQKGKRKAKKNEAKDVIDKDALFTDDVKKISSNKHTKNTDFVVETE